MGIREPASVYLNYIETSNCGLNCTKAGAPGYRHCTVRPASLQHRQQLRRNERICFAPLPYMVYADGRTADAQDGTDVAPRAGNEAIARDCTQRTAYRPLLDSRPSLSLEHPGRQFLLRRLPGCYFRGGRLPGRPMLAMEVTVPSAVAARMCGPARLLLSSLSHTEP